MHYFDYAAATPISSNVKEAMEPYFSEIFYNPSALYLAAQDVQDTLESARKEIAGVLGAKSTEIIFTAGGTEADNLAIQGVMSQYPDANVVVSAIEHDAILEVAKQYNYKIAPVQADGRVDAQALTMLVDDQTVLISVMYANNEIGTIEPLKGIAHAIKEINWQRAKKGNTLPLYFHTDASQAPNYLPVLVHTLGVDLMSLNAGKIYGPKETGVLFVKSGIHLEPIIRGGGQEKGLRSGTQNVANVVGFAAALKEADTFRLEESSRMLALQKEAIILLDKLLPQVKINGAMGTRLPNNIHILIPGIDNERVLMELDEKGFMVAAGSACSASSDEPSHVLKAIGLTDAEARSSLRITMGRDTTSASVKALIKTLAKIVRGV